MLSSVQAESSRLAANKHSPAVQKDGGVHLSCEHMSSRQVKRGALLTLKLLIRVQMVA